jgi:hypothetical protein
VSTAWLIGEFAGETDTCYHFLLPTRASSTVKKIKLDIIETMKHMHKIIIPVIKFFDPILPRKYLTVLVIGSWKQILAAKGRLLSEISMMSGYEDLEQFFPFVQAQMYRHIFKNSAKFIHFIEKCLKPAFPQSEYKNVYILKFWDVYSAEVILSVSNSDPVSDFLNKVMSHLCQDIDTMLNLIRLCDNEPQVKYLLDTQFRISPQDTLKKSFIYFNNFCKEFEGKGKPEYFNLYLQGVSTTLIDESAEEDILEEDNSRIIEKIVGDVRTVDRFKRFTVFPLSYAADIDMDSWNPAPESKLNAYLHNLERRKFLLGSDNHSNQIITPVQALYDVKENADFIVGCAKSPGNLLYVTLADSQK